ncbi:MAG: GMC family oxidoreductase, partial [Planctomycetaceae bacterium]|nr:GMC family oxidoreductase [Planctomycetaceae bacterium]
MRHGMPDRRGAIKAAIGTLVCPACAATESVAAASTPAPSRQIPTYGERAASDYQSSLKDFGGRLECDRDALAEEYDVVVIGSGYGGSVLAARLAAAMKNPARLCILERGSEWLPGSFPDSMPGFLANRGSGQGSALFAESTFRDLHILHGYGLGGTSLINLNVGEIPPPDIFETADWPWECRGFQCFEPFYELARTCLQPSANLQRQSAAATYLQQAAAVSHFDHRKAMITVRCDDFDGPVMNSAGMLQRSCIRCGDCATGCNVGAKNTLAYNYLPLARRHGAQIFCGMLADRISLTDRGCYEVGVRSLPLGSPKTVQDLVGHQPYRTIRARCVVVGAGVTGSLQLLLNSARHGLPAPPALGQRFHTNGDIFCVAELPHEMKTSTSEEFLLGTAPGQLSSADFGPGPGIESLASLRNPGCRMMIQDLRVPHALGPLFQLLAGSTHRHAYWLGMFDDPARCAASVRRDGTLAINTKGLRTTRQYTAAVSMMRRLATATGASPLLS